MYHPIEIEDLHACLLAEERPRETRARRTQWREFAIIISGIIIGSIFVTMPIVTGSLMSDSARKVMKFGEYYDLKFEPIQGEHVMWRCTQPSANISRIVAGSKHLAVTYDLHAKRAPFTVTYYGDAPKFCESAWKARELCDIARATRANSNAQLAGNYVFLAMIGCATFCVLLYLLSGIGELGGNPEFVICIAEMIATFISMIALSVGMESMISQRRAVTRMFDEHATFTPAFVFVFIADTIETGICIITFVILCVLARRYRQKTVAST